MLMKTASTSTLKILSLTLLLLGASLAASTTLAEEFIWTGGAGNTVWSNPANWTNTTPGGTDLFPDVNDTVTFPTDATVTGGSAENLLTANGFTLTLAQGTVSVGGTITNTGTITYVDSTGGTDEILSIDGTVTLDGGGEIVLNSNDAFLGDGSVASC